MSDQHDSQQTSYLERVSVDLSRSLRRCHALVDDCRDKLAANSNEPEFMLRPGSDEDERPN